MYPLNLEPHPNARIQETGAGVWVDGVGCRDGDAGAGDVEVAGVAELEVDHRKVAGVVGVGAFQHTGAAE